jgi:calcineurin-like phosphoesterase family protein
MKYTTPVIKKDQPDDTYKFQPLPKPTGKYPYRLSLAHVQPIVSDQQLVFHLVGDTGGRINPSFQRLVSEEMARHYKNCSSVAEQPQFLYHLGDIVYHHGEAEQYANQFFTPYKNYPGPIFAIAGNHDSDVNPDNPFPYQSLAPFKAVFCDTVSRPVSFSGGSKRNSMVQPNIYWTLETPLATIIGLHSNVPKFGVITNEQRNWFVEELKAADLQRKDKALIVCLHHAPYSADINHGSSLPMIGFLEGVYEETGIRPDLVLSGHVHNYQRFSKKYQDGKSLTYIVCGSGGFDELHDIADLDDERFTNESRLFKDVELQQSFTKKHGFLKLSIKKEEKGLRITGNYYVIPHDAQTEDLPVASLSDQFTIAL